MEMLDFIKQLRHKIELASKQSLSNVVAFRKNGISDAELNASGEVIAFALVGSMIDELEKEYISKVQINY